MATSDLDSDKLERAMVSALRENTIKVEDIAAQVDRKLDAAYERMAQLIRSYREDTSRSITSIYVRITSFEDTFETDRSTRVARQESLDTRLAAIESNQRFLVRFAVVAGLVAVGIVVGWLFL